MSVVSSGKSMVNAASSDEAKDLLSEAVKIMEKNVDYADALYELAQGVSVAKDKSEERVSVPATAISGIVLRAYRMGQWREASSHDQSISNIRELARKVSSFRPMQKNGIKLQELKPWKIDAELPVKIKPSEVETKEKLDGVRRLFNTAMNSDKRIVNANVSYSELTLERIFANTEGNMLRQVIPRTSLFVVPIAREHGKMDYDYLSLGGSIGFEILKDLDERKVKETVDSSINLLGASAPPSGRMTVILDQGMTGTFAHESFGHGCEADQILRKRSYLAPFFGKRMGFEKLSICDDGTVPNGNGSFLFDDEGVKSKKNYILRSGTLVGYLHERYSASVMNVDPTGNGRRESFLRKLFVRMTNTYVEPGDYSFNEMIGEVDKGVVLMHMVSGMEDPLAGGMELKCKKGYVIENGKLGRLLSSLTLSEYVPDFIASIDAIEKGQFEIDRGMCGKGYEDYVPVGSGGGHIRGKAVVGQG
jgi:TldD protein